MKVHNKCQNGPLLTQPWSRLVTYNSSQAVGVFLLAVASLVMPYAGSNWYVPPREREREKGREGGGGGSEGVSEGGREEGRE